MAIYLVKKGDTLSEIAEANLSTIRNYVGNSSLGTYQAVDYLVDWNDIADPDVLVVGQVLSLTGASSSSTKKATNTNKATIRLFGIQSNTENTLYVTWDWSRDQTENYKTMWYYDTGNGVWFVGSDSTTDYKQSTYSIPNNAIRVKFKVKPISKTHSVDNKEVNYWTADWSTEKVYDCDDLPPVTPDVPEVTIDKYKLTATLTNVNPDDLHAEGIHFQIVRDDKQIYRNGKVKIVMNTATFSCNIAAGSKYKVRARSYRGLKDSNWSQYSGNVSSMPTAPADITVCRANSETSVYLEWKPSTTAKTYEIEYTTDINHFDISNDTTTQSGITTTRYEITGLETGDEYFFRVRAVGENSETSPWTKIKSCIIGTEPAAPTTWSSTTTAITGEDLILYWVHNAEDGSHQTLAQVEIREIGPNDLVATRNIDIEFEDDEEEDENKTRSYTIDTHTYDDGVKIEWRVRTAGITRVYGDWSMRRTVDVYAPPTLAISVTKNLGEDGELIESLETLESYPFYIQALAGPHTQTPIGYHVSIIANETYETVDNIGNPKVVNKGDAVYSKYYDTSQVLILELSANSVNLDNNISYTIIVMSSMNSGLTAEVIWGFKVAWTEEERIPNCEIGVNTEDFTCMLRPYCEDENFKIMEDIELSVYRREYDGKFTEIATGLENSRHTYVTDPHPALDFARYRIIATSKLTGAVSYFDPPGHYVGGKAIVIQWDEVWTNFDISENDDLEQPTYSGSLLKLPYNIDVSNNHAPDVSLINYVGREHPVAYYGTHVGETASWSTAIPKTDTETLYALRRLAKYMGNVYVREPSGSGYWANITVSFNQSHCDPVIPVTLDVTRVEGGM